MARIPRTTQKIFGGNLAPTPTAGLAVYGSLTAGSPSFSADPAAIQSLPNWLQGFAGAFYPGSQQSPTFEDFNGLMYVITSQLAYLMQSGVPEWDPNTTYYIGSLVNDGLGNIYKSLQNSNTNQALSSTTYWSTIIDNRQMCKAWVNFDGRTGAILDSYNVSSVTRESQGQYMIHFTTPMSNANYAWSSSCGNQQGVQAQGGDNYMAGVSDASSTSWPAWKTTSALRVYCLNADTNTREDASSTSVIVFGS